MINKYGGLAGIKDAGALEYVCEKPFLQLFNQEQYPDIFHKAAVLMFAIARRHYFYDGNKRTAAMGVYSFLMKNNYELIVSNNALYNTCIKIATGEMSENQLEKWIKLNTFPL